jgi:hypothetical protein
MYYTAVQLPSYFKVHAPLYLLGWLQDQEARAEEGAQVAEKKIREQPDYDGMDRLEVGGRGLLAHIHSLQHACWLLHAQKAAQTVFSGLGGAPLPGDQVSRVAGPAFSTGRIPCAACCMLPHHAGPCLRAAAGHALHSRPALFDGVEGTC